MNRFLQMYILRLHVPLESYFSTFTHTKTLSKQFGPIQTINIFSDCTVRITNGAYYIDIIKI